MPSSKDKLVKQLMENSIELQKSNVELVNEMRKLTKKVGDMVKLFEEAAKSIRQGMDEPLMKRLEELIDQNKNIAKGLILLEKYVREKSTLSSGFQKPLQSNVR